MKRKSIPTSADFDLLKRIAKNFCIATGSTERYKENIIRPLKSFNLKQKQKCNFYNKSPCIYFHKEKSVRNRQD